ncbi:MAG: AMP-binding protein [Syntrophales bacterium]|nr:AMP-binding protein [Syntrophales bacterium]HOG07074.1 AMP-binding protein [Syntrophales bacterium]HOS77799.1 AMP-binding protein [Syntrophales bacterium]HPB71003.1 AMP-binding protein [Syntrophales bacterium]HQN26063.1 AMP-binding protein [Syntrophales bacterium]
MTYNDRPWVRFYNEWVHPEVSIPEKTYLDYLNESFRRNPHRPALYFMGKEIVFGELEDLSARFANFLAEIGCVPGTPVSVITPNIPQNQIANVGICRAGCVAQGISLLLTPTEMAYQLNHSGARVLIILDLAFEQKFVKIQQEVPNLTHVVVCRIGDYLPAVKRVLGGILGKLPTGQVTPIAGKHVLTFSEVMRNHPAQAPDVRLSPEDTCLIQYTGGTTGIPKGAEVTHRNIVSCLVQMKNWLDLKEMEEVYCSAFPFFHIAGLFVGMINLSMGNPQVLIPDPRNIEHFCKAYVKHRPTGVANVPVIYQQLAEEPAFRAADHSRCKAFISAASPLPEKLYRRLEATVGQGKVLELFGMTETMVTSLDAPGKKKKIGSVGLPWPAYRLKIVDLESGTREMPIGQEGELIIRGPGVMKGYWRMPEETAHALRELDGEKWLYTGDVVRMDDDGYLYVVDRCKDMIDVRGYNVFSREVEDRLYQHPSVEFCAVVGVPDPERPGTQQVKAVIQLKAEFRKNDPKALQSEILEHCRETLAHYKVPQAIEFVESIPLTSVGKVDKKVLRPKAS